MKNISAMLVLALAGAAGWLVAQGPLTPPSGPPAPGMKTLDQVEPRTPISSLPFTISASGSYYVTGNLTGVAGQHGIIIDADHVTLDLGGFELAGAGPTATRGIRVVTGRVNATIRNGTVRGWLSHGMVAEAPTVTEVRVEKIRAIGNGGSGIQLGNNATVEQCETRGNGGHGIVVGASCKIIACTSVGQTGASSDGIQVDDDCVLDNCVTTGNVSDGVQAGFRCAMSHCVANDNNFSGFVGGSGSVVSNCSASDNGDNGFSFTSGVTLESCTAYRNTGLGIIVGVGAVVAHCTVQLNEGSAGIFANGAATIIGCTLRGNTSSASSSAGITAGGESLISQCLVTDTATTAAVVTSQTGAGIAVGTGCTIERCTVDGSKGDGIRIPNSCLVIGNTCVRNGSTTGDGAGIHALNVENRIEGNTVNGNDRGIDVDSTGSLIIKNTAATNTIDYVIAANNRYGPIINITAGGTAAVSGSSAASTLTSTDPWANFVY